MKNFVIVLLALSTVFVACNNTDSGEAASTEEVMNKQQRVSKATFKAF